MRWLGLGLLCIAASATAAPRASNPAFLGIQMEDHGASACMIAGATRNGPAEAAGLRAGDIVVAVDESAILSCTSLLDVITSHVPGEAIKVTVRRAGGISKLTVHLTTRDAVLAKAIGKPLGETFTGVDDGMQYDLSDLHEMAIVAIYNPACMECAQLVSKLGSWQRRTARKGTPALVLAVSSGEPTSHDAKALQKALDVPLAMGGLFGEGRGDSPFTLLYDRERLGVIVIDSHGDVQYVGPVAPGTDDTDAVLDEVFAAADQAARHAN